MLSALNLKENDGVQVDIRKFSKVGKSEKSIVQKLFEELKIIFIRLYRSKASSSAVFARTIHNSIEMQKYFGITANGLPSPGRNLDDFEIYFIDKLFKIIPNSAQFSWDYDRIRKYQTLLLKDSPPDTLKDILPRFFNYIIKFVSEEFNIKLEFGEDISI